MKIKKVLATLKLAHEQLLKLFWTLYFLRKVLTVVISIILTLHAIHTELITISEYITWL